MGSQIPIEPSYFILNTAVSSTWGFPYVVPSWCTKCYDCEDPQCDCAFYPGFCDMLEGGKTAMYVDNIRLYQSKDDSAHVGGSHTLGCDPPDYPTKEWIDGHTYRYMRNPPFSYKDKKPLRNVQKGGGKCRSDQDCSGRAAHQSRPAVKDNQTQSERKLETTTRGFCVRDGKRGLFSVSQSEHVCSCADGFTGPFCKALDVFDDTPSAYKTRRKTSPFRAVSALQIPFSMILFGGILVVVLLSVLFARVRSSKSVKDYRIQQRMTST